MLKHLTHVNQWVTDQDEAKAFYTEKLGLELREDATVPEMGNFRWLAVGPAGQPEVAVALLKVPGPPVLAEETAAAVNDVVAKGAAGGLFFDTEDIKSTYQALKDRGVEITQEPTQQPYGVDMAVRDPFGNQIRIAQIGAQQ
jgi:catechol 2,3-dioxygenase-like lactoylglutathione lyase family enzyme